MRFMLCCHPDVCIAPETNFFNHWMRMYSHLDISKPDDFDLFWHDFGSSDLFRVCGVAPSAVLERLRREKDPSFPGVFGALCREYARRMGKPIWGEKTPRHEEYARDLLRWFPRARIVYMLRDPRATASSLMSMSFGSRYCYVHAHRWSRSISRAVELQEDSRFHIVRFEELLRDGEKVLRELCGFLHLAYSPDMLQRRDASRYCRYPDSPDANRNVPVSRRLTPTVRDKWKERLSPYQIRVIESICGPWMRSLGYAPLSSGFSPGPLFRARRYLEYPGRFMELLATRPIRKALSVRLKSLHRPLVRSAG